MPSDGRKGTGGLLRHTERDARGSQATSAQSRDENVGEGVEILRTKPFRDRCLTGQTPIPKKTR